MRGNNNSKWGTIRLGIILAVVFGVALLVLTIVPASAVGGPSQLVADVTVNVSGGYNGAFSCYSSLTVSASVGNYHQQTVLHLNSFYDTLNTYDLFPTTHTITISISGYGSQTVNFVSTLLGASFSGSATFHNLLAGSKYTGSLSLDNGGCFLSGVNNPTAFSVSV